MEHVHGPNCGCKDVLLLEGTNDLLQSIDIQKIRCLNEKLAHSCKKLFRPFETRFSKELILTSESDGQVLLVIPFISEVKIRSICVIGKDQFSFPQTMRLYVNQEHINFDLTEQQPIQQFMLGSNLDGNMHYALKQNKFTHVHKLIMHLKNVTIQEMGVSYIQIKGEDTKIQRKPVITVYELNPAAQKKDLKELQKNTYSM